MNREDKLKVITYELVFLIENPDYLTDVASWLAQLTPDMIERKLKEIQE